MEAVIATGGKQYRVATGQVIEVERLGKPKGSSVEFDKVLLVNKDGQVTVEPKALTGARVTGEARGLCLGPKDASTHPTIPTTQKSRPTDL